MRKKNKLMLIISAIFVIAAIIFIVLGYALSGADILAWFASKWAYLFYIVCGIWVFALLFIVCIDRIKRL